MKIDGGCYCGQIRYSFDGEVTAALQCHCRECQYLTGGHPNVIVVVPDAGFSYTQGEPSGFSRPDLDNPVTRYFCSNCGTGIGTTSPNAPGAMILKVGTMDDPSFYEPGLAIFTKDAQSFHHIRDDIPNFEGVPG